jgi:hypothetical protein
MRVRQYAASVTYRNGEGKLQEEEFPVNSRDHAAALRTAFAYVLQIMKLEDFELRVVGS